MGLAAQERIRRSDSASDEKGTVWHCMAVCNMQEGTSPVLERTVEGLPWLTYDN